MQKTLMILLAAFALNSCAQMDAIRDSQAQEQAKAKTQDGQVIDPGSTPDQARPKPSSGMETANKMISY